MYTWFDAQFDQKVLAVSNTEVCNAQCLMCDSFHFLIQIFFLFSLNKIMVQRKQKNPLIKNSNKNFA